MGVRAAPPARAGFYKEKAPVIAFSEDLEPGHILKCQGHHWSDVDPKVNYLVTLLHERGLGQQLVAHPRPAQACAAV